MATEEVLLTTIYSCLDELNLQLPSDRRLSKVPTSVLVGEAGVLDSLGLITLLVNIEQALSERHGLTVPLLDELTAEHDGPHPFGTLSALARWVANRPTGEPPR